MDAFSTILLEQMHDAIWNTTIMSIAILIICTILMPIEWYISREDRRLAYAPELIRNYLKQDPANYPLTMVRVPAAQRRVKIHNFVFYSTMAVWFFAYLLFMFSTLCMVAISCPQAHPELFDWLANLFTNYLN